MVLPRSAPIAVPHGDRRYKTAYRHRSLIADANVSGRDRRLCGGPAHVFHFRLLMGTRDRRGNCLWIPHRTSPGALLSHVTQEATQCSVERRLCLHRVQRVCLI